MALQHIPLCITLITCIASLTQTMECNNVDNPAAESIVLLCKNGQKVSIDQATAQRIPLLKDIIDTPTANECIPVERFDAGTIQLFIKIINRVYIQAPILAYDPHFFEETDTHPAFTLADIPKQLQQAGDQENHYFTWVLSKINVDQSCTQEVYAAISYFFYLSDRVITDPDPSHSSIADIIALDRDWIMKGKFPEDISFFHCWLLSLAGIHLLPSKTKKLYLLDNGIRTIYPHAFAHFKNLVELDLSKNSFEFLPNNRFIGLNVLKKLDLSYNALRTIDSNAFAGLHQLEILNLERNNLRSMPTNALACLENLKEINLKDNRIKRLKKHALYGLSSLITLNLELNKIRSLHRRALRGLFALKYLTLSNNGIGHIPDNLCRDLKNLDSLELCSNNITCLSKKSLKGLRRVEYIDLGDNEIETIEDNAFKGLSNLKILFLNINKISAVSDHTFAGATKLKKLFLGTNDLTVEENAFTHLPNLKELFYGNDGNNKCSISKK